jgi:hypothetical protein
MLVVNSPRTRKSDISDMLVFTGLIIACAASHFPRTHFNHRVNFVAVG